MDPDEILAKIQDISRYTPAATHVGDAFREMAHLFNQLDDWIQMGGELPGKWRKGSVTGHNEDRGPVGRRQEASWD